MATQSSQAKQEKSKKNPFVARRSKLFALIKGLPVVVHAGLAPARNYQANPYPFRASSHFLYLTGLTHLPSAALALHDGKSVLFTDPITTEDELWDGPKPSWEELQAESGVDEIQPLSNLAPYLERMAAARRWGYLPLPPWSSPESVQAGQAIATLRLQHDEAAIHELKRAAAVTARAHAAGMQATRPGVRESFVRAAMEQVIQAENFTTAYGSIVTVRGEVLHNHDYGVTCQSGDLLLADVGAETDTGWASDVTRTWPVGGVFSPTQRDAYAVVLEAQKQAISMVKPGVRYKTIHLEACLALAKGLCALEILKGDPQDLVERGAHAVFFPHGVGHLLGLDVHDMEDLGEDTVGYQQGRTRSSQFGTKYLRLDRDLLPGMAVTIEPGLYFIPALWKHESIVGPFRDDINWDKVRQFQDVRGIRIEDNVLVTESGKEVLTEAIPKEIADVEACIAAKKESQTDVRTPNAGRSS